MHLWGHWQKCFSKLSYRMTVNQKKALLKRSADMAEKLAVGSLLVGLFKGIYAGFAIGFLCMCLSYWLTCLEAQK